MGMKQRKWRMAAGALLMAAMLWMPGHALAASSDVCTNFAQTQADTSASTDPGLLTNITNYIKTTIGGATQKLYEAFINSSNYQSIVYAAVTLMIVIYGVAFLMGVVQASFAETLKRLVKIGFVLTLISTGGWAFFNENVVSFFNDGTDQLIGGVMAIAAGIDPSSLPPNSSPFLQLDRITNFVLQPDTLVKVLGTMAAGGPYGMAMGGLLGISVFGMIKMVLEALKSYAVSFVVRSLLLGVAPVFIVFLLFDRTKSLFTGWLNSLLNLSLQPILYFTFLSFFIVMITNASHDMLKGELCWTEFKSVSGSTNKPSFWRLQDKDGKPITDELRWDGTISCVLSPPPGGCTAFPINIIDLLTFLILVYIAQKFGGVVDNISGEISNVFVNIDKAAKMEYASLTGGGGPSVNPNAGDAAKPTKNRTP